MLKLLTTILMSLLVCHICSSQDIEYYYQIRDSLANQVRVLEDSLSAVDDAINRMKLLALNEKIKKTGVQGVLTSEVPVRERNDLNSAIVTRFPRGKVVKIIDYQDDRFLVTDELSVGWISKLFFEKSDEIESFVLSKELEEEEDRVRMAALQVKWAKEREIELVEIEKQRKIEKIETERRKAVRQKEAKERDEKYTALYGSQTYLKLKKGYYWIGMSDDMALISLGNPQDINRTVGTWGVHEQWIYDNKDIYLYFENGVLVSYQN